MVLNKLEIYILKVKIKSSRFSKRYAKANTTGIALAGGAASTGLLGNLLVTGATTAADTFIDGDTKNFNSNLLINLSTDLLGNGLGKIKNFKNFLKNNSDLQKWVFDKGSLKNKISDGKFIYNEFVNPDWKTYRLNNKMTLSKINRDWDLQYLNQMFTQDKLVIPEAIPTLLQKQSILKRQNFHERINTLLGMR